MRPILALALCGLMLANPGAVQADDYARSLERIPSLVRAAPGGGKGVNLCSFAAALNRDQNGPVSLHAGPRTSARVLARLPTFREEAGERLSPEFRVIGSKDGWLLVQNVGFDGYDLPARRLHRGAGWLHGSHVHFQIEGPWFFEAPHPESRRIANRVSAETPEIETRLVSIHGCSGSMFDVTVELPGKKMLRGWGFGACSNQVTTCGGGGRIAIEKAGRIIVYEQD